MLWVVIISWVAGRMCLSRLLESLTSNLMNHSGYQLRSSLQYVGYSFDLVNTKSCYSYCNYRAMLSVRSSNLQSSSDQMTMTSFILSLKYFDPSKFSSGGKYILLYHDVPSIAKTSRPIGFVNNLRLDYKTFNPSCWPDPHHAKWYVFHREMEWDI